MNIRVFGALEATIDGRPVSIGAVKPRAVLAILALRAGETVSTERLIEGLWGEQPPATAVKLVQLYVSQLRKALAESGDGAAIVTHGRGYALVLASEDVDAGRFEQLVAEGAPREALSLWRGSPLDDVSGEPFAAPEIRRLQELRLSALEQAIDADLEAGRHSEVVGELDVLVAEEPLRERLHAQRMLALYRSRRQADALAAYREARSALVEQVGVEPGPELRRLQEAILAQDAALEEPCSLAEWARADAARRLGAAVGRAASERAELRAAEDEVAGGVEELQTARAGPARVVSCPFKGLASFDVEDAGVFFGRERLVAEMVARLAGAPLMAVVGPSGSGKSSALRAGLLAAIGAGVLPGSERWAIALLRPGARPLRELERATAGLEGRSVLAIDQFEELFTACRDESERAAFAGALATAAGGPRRQTLVLMAVRADFYGRCAAYPELARLMGANHVLVGPMRRDELRRAIELPAERAGLVVEPDLTDALVADVIGEPGALPLLSSSLLELWQRRDGHRLRMSAYDQAGGVRGAVARLAERAYERLDPERRDVARRILLRLAGEGEGDAVVRRRVALAELEGEGVPETLAVLADQRLVTIGDGEVEVAHEALLREWPRLRGWLEEDADGRRLHAHLIGAARDWQAAARDPGELYRGARLAATLDWAAAHDGDLNQTEREFLDASRSRAERDADRQRLANRRLRALLASAAVLLAAAVVGGVAAISQRGEARDAALAADAQRLGAQALIEDRIDHALLLARAGVALHESPATLGSLLSVLQRNPMALAEFRGDGWPLNAVSASPDGRLVALGDEHGTVAIYDAPSRRRLGGYQLRNGGLVQQVSFSPDGSTLAVAGFEGGNEDRPVLDLIDPATGRRRVRIAPPRLPEPAAYVVLNAVFVRDGQDVLVIQMHEGFNPDGPASVVQRFDGETGRAQRPPLRLGTHSAMGLSASADGRWVFTTSLRDRVTYKVDAERLRVADRWPVAGYSGTVSPDGRTFALGSEDGHVSLLGVRSGAVRTMQDSHRATVLRLAFAPDGRTLATADADGTIAVWDVGTGALRERLGGHGGDVWGLEVSADGRTLYSAGTDARALAWDLAGDRRLDRWFRPGPAFTTAGGDRSPRGFAISPDGSRLAATQSDGTVDLLDTRTLAPRGRFRGLDGYAAAVAFSPDGRLLAVTGKEGRVTLWDARTLRPAGELLGLPARHAQTLAFSPDGRLLASAWIGDVQSEGGEALVWDVRRREPTRVRFPIATASVAFSPDGRLLAAAGAGPGAPSEIRDARTGALVKRLRTPDFGRSIAFSRDGALLAIGLYDGSIQLRSTKDWAPVGPLLEGHGGRVTALEFAPDSRTLLSGGGDGTVVLWDVAARKQLGSPLTVETNGWISAKFAPDGQRVFAVSDGPRGVRWEVSPDAWKRQACRVAGRELSAREWQDALAGRPYRAVCR
jgi:WD40 repeat protein/DNA-binding SARP family transcriptional activator